MITPLIVIPPLFAGRAARGDRRDSRSRTTAEAHNDAPSHHGLVLMIIVAVIAVDLAVLQLMRGAGNRALASTMPIVDVLGVFLATTVGKLRRRGEPALSHVMFLLGPVNCADILCLSCSPET